jgi:pimeloyl-ACP methyl ester carboxylesterase
MARRPADFASTLAVWAVLAALPLCCGGIVAPQHVIPNSTFDSGILRVERFGNSTARSIVFVPALFCGSWEWNAQIDALSSRYDVLAVTLPGFGGRPMVAGDDLMNRAAQSLHLLLTTHNLNQPIIVGHSLGGTLAVYYAARFPHDLTGVVTVEGGYPTAPTQALRDAKVAKSVALYQGVSQSDVGKVIRDQALRYEITSPADVDAVEPLAARSDPDAIAQWIRAALSLDLTPDLKNITVPLTAIVPFDPTIDPYQGFRTEAAKRSAYDSWVAHAPIATVILLAPSRHFVMFDQPEEFEAALESVLTARCNRCHPNPVSS